MTWLDKSQLLNNTILQKYTYCEVVVLFKSIGSNDRCINGLIKVIVIMGLSNFKENNFLWMDYVSTFGESVSSLFSLCFYNDTNNFYKMLYLYCISYKMKFKPHCLWLYLSCGRNFNPHPLSFCMFSRHV